MPSPRLSVLSLILSALVSTDPAALSQVKSTRSDNGAAAKTQEAPDYCPVTKPVQAFVPPNGHAAKAPGGEFWFGTDGLWTRLPMSGTWGLGHYTPNDPTYRQKLFFWRQGFVAQNDRQPHLSVTGKRLDAPASPLLSDQANGTRKGADQFMVTGINFPTFVCWEVTAHYQDAELTFVVWVKQ